MREDMAEIAWIFIKMMEKIGRLIIAINHNNGIFWKIVCSINKIYYSPILMINYNYAKPLG